MCGTTSTILFGCGLTSHHPSTLTPPHPSRRLRRHLGPRALLLFLPFREAHQHPWRADAVRRQHNLFNYSMMPLPCQQYLCRTKHGEGTQAARRWESGRPRTILVQNRKHSRAFSQRWRRRGLVHDYPAPSQRMEQVGCASPFSFVSTLHILFTA